MKKMVQRYQLFLSLLCFLSFVLTATTAAAQSLFANHNSAADFSSIPDASFPQARSSLNIYYGHTSHGSQLLTGLQMLYNERPLLYIPPPIYDEDGIDLGDSSWSTRTRQFLNTHPQTNLVLWSWCGQLSDYSTAEVNAYLTQKSQLEADYPGVTFVYMTGHLDGTGPAGTLYRNNNLIRNYCQTYDKVLFDFADIESFDPDGNYYPGGSDWCEWCTTWCAGNTCPPCDDCAHSQCFNCYQKGKAFWWMMACLVGWNPGLPALPIPDIKVNGSNGPVTVNQGDTVSVQVSVDPGGYAGRYLDWWVYASTPFDWYSYVYPSGWSPGLQRTIATPLFPLPGYEVFRGTLPSGNYTLTFGLDNNADGLLDLTSYDQVELQVQ